ncbi:MAG: BlaI/MecI/CopY family transcriptional regulator [Planctomycetaceae bacterium]|jgi:predicted transcriptional regulator|nr:BlaI/MecI/CopY family transcriptional regulator [Planctomycetaceae bacterium]
MKKRKNILHHLSRRERQIAEAVVKLGQASVSQVLAEIPDPPTYTSIRTILQLLVKKDILRFESDGKRYLYRIKANQNTVRTAAVNNLLATFFPDSTSAAITAILDIAADRLDADELDEIQQKIKQAKKDNRRTQ